MSMAIQRTSANTVPAMIYPVAKLSKLAKFGPGSSKSGATQAPAPRSQTADTPSTADQVHAAFQYARAGLSSVGMSGTGMTQASPEVQSGVHQGVSVQQADRVMQNADAAYSQGDQEVGQALDITG